MEQLYDLARAHPDGLPLKGLRLEEDLVVEYRAGEIEGAFVQGPYPVFVLIFDGGEEVALPLYDAEKDVRVI